MDIKEAGLIQGDIGKHWYYRAKLSALRHITRDLNSASLLDVGAGLGFFSSALLGDTGLAEATCVDPGYPADRDETAAGKPLRFRRHIDRTDADLVLMMDVIEHVQDDVGLVAEYVAKVRPGTQFVVTVPAFMWLWSGHDVFLEHCRRYTLSGVERTLRTAGLRIERGCYFYGALLPLVTATRMAERLLHRGRWTPRSQMQDHGTMLNFMLWTVCRMEMPVFQANRVAGLTAFVRAVKA
jgi:2-polyprenyl-3-methyl-5-hydroxy-6-metoxy-1,4-benzoquinol methylase